MAKTKIAINGFGRIGRTAFRIIQNKPDMEVVAINDLSGAATCAQILKFDTTYGRFGHDISATEKELVIHGNKIPVYTEMDPTKLPWKDLSVDVVLECTGHFTSSDKAKAHIDAGAKKVVISAPAKDEGVTPTYVLGVNDKDYKNEPIVSNASCTTNCISPVSFVLERDFGIDKMMMTTVHSVTAEQNLVDGLPPGLKGGDFRRARSAMHNIVPTTTGAAISTTKVIPSISGKFDGLSLRVPTLVGSLADFTALLKKDVTKEDINNAFLKAEKEMPGVLATTTEPIVSSDVIGRIESVIVDLSLTNVVGGNLVKVIAWYDNEFGYSNRLVELASKITK